MNGANGTFLGNSNVRTESSKDLIEQHEASTRPEVTYSKPPASETLPTIALQTDAAA